MSQKPSHLGVTMNGNFYSNDLLAKIRMDERMAEAEAYRRATQVEQSDLSEQSPHRIAVHPFVWFRRLVLRLGGAEV
jgi:hypothetical protein